MKPYENVLFYNEFDQKKSIVAIKNVVPFFKACPFAEDVVKAVRAALQANIPKYNDLQLQPAELTFFPRRLWLLVHQVAHRFRGA